MLFGMLDRPEPPHTLRFGRFELQPHQRRLLADGQVAALGARAFDLLVTLASRPGQLVTKGALLDEVWPGLVVEEDAAGGGACHDPEHAALADWHAVMRTNLDGVFLGCKHALRTMRRGTQRGSIINIASRSGRVGVPAAAAYAASKAAVLNHTRSVALYCAEQGLPVRCNANLPAAVLTPMCDPLIGQGAQRKATMAAMVAETPLRRFAQPTEVAALAVLLASDECLTMTGSELHVDGGLMAGSAALPRA
jgi:NAD(P)-dependent dehydrogenase (short-subunit alcohol dehydrogenase family)